LGGEPCKFQSREREVPGGGLGRPGIQIPAGAPHNSRANPGIFLFVSLII